MRKFLLVKLGTNASCAGSPHPSTYVRYQIVCKPSPKREGNIVRSAYRVDDAQACRERNYNGDVWHLSLRPSLRLSVFAVKFRRLIHNMLPQDHLTLLLMCVIKLCASRSPKS